MNTYINELLAEGNTTVAEHDRCAFLTECAARQIYVFITDAVECQGILYTRYDLV